MKDFMSKDLKSSAVLAAGVYVTLQLAHVPKYHEEITPDVMAMLYLICVKEEERIIASPVKHIKEGGGDGLAPEGVTPVHSISMDEHDVHGVQNEHSAPDVPGEPALQSSKDPLDDRTPPTQTSSLDSYKEDEERQSKRRYTDTQSAIHTELMRKEREEYFALKLILKPSSRSIVKLRGDLVNAARALRKANRSRNMASIKTSTDWVSQARKDIKTDGGEIAAV